GFREKINRHAFDRALASGQDVRLLWNHNQDEPLARVSNKSLRLWTDDAGLHFDAVLPNTTRGRDLHELIRSGVVGECSFGFGLAKSDGDRWFNEVDPKTGQQTLCRELLDLRLQELSPVTFPAYSQGTQVDARAVETDASDEDEYYLYTPDYD